MFQRTSILILLTVSVILAACAPSSTPTPSAPSTVRPTAVAPTAILQFTLVPTSTNKGNPSMGGPSMGTPVPRPTPLGVAQVNQAKEDLAKRLSVPVSQIELVSGQFVTWSDGSLGCPKPGLAYIQVLTDGYRIQLAVSGKLYEYHASKTGAPFLCDTPQPPASVGE